MPGRSRDRALSTTAEAHVRNKVLTAMLAGAGVAMGVTQVLGLHPGLAAASSTPGRDGADAPGSLPQPGTAALARPSPPAPAPAPPAVLPAPRGERSDAAERAGAPARATSARATPTLPPPRVPTAAATPARSPAAAPGLGTTVGGVVQGAGQAVGGVVRGAGQAVGGVAETGGKVLDRATSGVGRTVGEVGGALDDTVEGTVTRLLE